MLNSQPHSSMILICSATVVERWTLIDYGQVYLGYAEAYYSFNVPIFEGNLNTVAAP